MSKPNHWSIEDATAAARKGWALHDVYDLTKRTVGRQILPLAFEPPLNNATAALRMVVGLSLNGDSLARKATQLLTKGKV